MLEPLGPMRVQQVPKAQSAIDNAFRQLEAEDKITLLSEEENAFVV